MFPGETLLSRAEEGEKPDPHYTELQVMHSPAGWYVGSYWKACKEKATACAGCLEDYDYLPPEHWGDITEPGSRETDYFDSPEEAEKALDGFNKTGTLLGKRI